MNKDIDTKEMRTHCYRMSKVPGEFMLQMRVPGGTINAKYLAVVQHMAETWGNGLFHFGTRQTFDIPGISIDAVPEVNKYIEDYIREVEGALGVNMDTMAGEPMLWNPSEGYPAIGSRNITACIGNQHCPMGQVDTTALAHKIEKLIYPSHYNIKINISGCPNDCNKAHVADFGIIGCSRLDYHPDRCIGCAGCVTACEKGATSVLSLNDRGMIDKDTSACVGCAECARVCPTSAWTREPTKFYKLMIGGRTGRQTPRMGRMFLNWATEETLLAVIANWQKFAAWVMDYKPEYLHGGHLIDRAGFKKFKELILDGVQLNPECIVAEDIYWHETEYRSNFNVKPVEQHHIAGPGAR